jgi:hypothetical protein
MGEEVGGRIVILGGNILDSVLIRRGPAFDGQPEEATSLHTVFNLQHRLTKYRPDCICCPRDRISQWQIDFLHWRTSQLVSN